MVIVDTTVWIDFLRGRHSRETDFLDAELGRQRLGLLDLILCEVLQGVRNDAAFQRVLREFRKFEVFETGGEEQAVAAAINFRILRRRGFTVRKTIDCWIATYCLRGGHSLLHRDRDFEPFEQILGLVVVRP
jgi:predicted nucleic acid-binding protein